MRIALWQTTLMYKGYLGYIYKAQAIASSDFLKTELSNKIKELAQWVKDAPQRREEAKVKVQVEKLSELAEKMFRFTPDTIPNVQKFVSDSEVLLGQMKQVLGLGSSVYQKYSTLIAQVALGSLITIVNKAQE